AVWATDVPMPARKIRSPRSSLMPSPTAARLRCSESGCRRRPSHFRSPAGGLNCPPITRGVPSTQLDTSSPYLSHAVSAKHAKTTNTSDPTLPRPLDILLGTVELPHQNPESLAVIFP